jgi:hypothetical protein
LYLSPLSTSLTNSQLSTSQKSLKSPKLLISLNSLSNIVYSNNIKESRNYHRFQNNKHNSVFSFQKILSLKHQVPQTKLLFIEENKEKKKSSHHIENNKKELFFCSFGCKKKKYCKHKTLFYSTLMNISKKPLEKLVTSIHPSVQSVVLPRKKLSSFSFSSSFQSSPFYSFSLINNYLSHYQRLHVFK